VEGPLAFRMRRAAAARAVEIGLQILTLSNLAARVAGDFRRPARSQELDEAIRKALEAGGFEDIESMRDLPGMTHAIARSLSKLWRAEIDLPELAKTHNRMRDLLLIDGRVRAALPPGALTLRDLRDAAMNRMGYAKEILGDVEIDQRADIAPLWRPLILALAREVSVTWREPAVATTWFTSEVVKVPARPPARVALTRVSCAHPRTETIEALRWMRELLANGIPANEIAICAASTETWDEHFDALATETALPLHFSHGRSALGTYEGQACAALADVLMQGLNQRRVRRGFLYAWESRGLSGLTTNWTRGIRRDAHLRRSGKGTAAWVHHTPEGPLLIRQQPGTIRGDAQARFPSP